MKRLAFAAAMVAALAPPAFADVTFGTPRLLGQFILPTGVSIDGVEFGGISGLDYDAKVGSTMPCRTIGRSTGRRDFTC